jgi:hypothetical protein
MKYTWNFFRHRSNLVCFEYLNKGRVVPPEDLDMRGWVVGGRTWHNFTEYSDSATVLLFFGIAKQRVSYVVPVELRSVCEKLCESVASRHSSYTRKTTRAFVREKSLQCICFWFVLSSPNNNSRADLFRLIFHYFRYTRSRNWRICLIVGRTFLLYVGEVHIPVIGCSAATVVAQRSSLNTWPSRFCFTSGSRW